jgi:hypothetical protein
MLSSMHSKALSFVIEPPIRPFPPPARFMNKTFSFHFVKTIFISADVCAWPGARNVLLNASPSFYVHERRFS